MGAINNAFNQAAGAVAGAALVIKHAKETEESKMNTADSTAIVARNQARAANDEANAAGDEAFKKGGLVEQLSAAEVDKDDAEKAYNKAVKRKNGSYKTRIKKLTELQAAEKAFDELNHKYQAMENINKRADEQIRYADKATEMAIKAKEKFEKHWGGIK